MVDASPRNDDLMRQLAEAHHGLAQRIASAESLSPSAVLDLGAAVLFHGAVERELLFPLSPWLDFAVQAEYAARHAQLADDLALLESLLETEPESPDVGMLASALLARLKEHIARDDRVFYHAVLP